MEPANRGAGSLREVGNERTGSGIPKVVETGRNRKKIHNNFILLYIVAAIGKAQRGRSQ